MKAQAFFASLALASFALAPIAEAGDVVIRAGTIHPVDGRPIEDGAIHLRDGVIVAVGADIAVPSGAEVVDYGDSAVIVPGFVDADSGYALGRGSARTAEPGLVALDSFDFFGRYSLALSSGVTSAYITPARNRLIAGQSSIVKLGGDDPARRVVTERSALHGSVGAAARNVPGFWEPPIPPTSDIGLGYAKPQLPRSTMGAVVAIEELLGAARRGVVAEEYGPHAAADLGDLMKDGTRWRMAADNRGEIRALLDLAVRHDLDLVIDGGREAASMASEIAKAGVSVVFRVPLRTNMPAVDWGKGDEAYWPDFSVPAALNEAGVRVAIAHTGSPRDLLFAARLALQGGLSTDLALRAITLTPAELLGASERIGSLTPGKDGDLVVFAGDPMGGGAPIATWLDGDLAWSEKTSGASAKSGHGAASTVVIEVEELHVGDGEVIRPGAVVLRNGKIVDVGGRVSRPMGAKVVQGYAAAPGMIDALGHLGLGGSRSAPGTDYPMANIITPGDETDRRVALSGVTTVLLSPRGENRAGLPLTAYKPASSSAQQVIADPATLRVTWSDRNRLNSGASVRSILQKAREYGVKWQEYETELAEWKANPPKPKAPKKKDDDEDEEEEEEEDEDDDKDKKKKKKKKKGDEEPEVNPAGGIWEGTIVRPPASDESSIRIQLVETDGALEGSIRCDALSDSLIEVEGRLEEHELSVVGLGDQGWVTLTGTAKEGELEGTISINGTEIELEAKRSTQEVPRASRPTPTAAAEEDAPDRSKPREPKRDGKLEPFWRAMQGDATIVVTVDREDEILACVDAFAAYGIRPVLRSARDLHWVADQVADRIAGVLLDYRVVVQDYDQGLEFVNRYERIANAGIPLAFHSLAEEGAADLPLRASYAVANGLSFQSALRALTSDAAAMFGIEDRVGRLDAGLDADVLVFDGPPLDPGTRVVRVFVDGEEVVR